MPTNEEVLFQAIQNKNKSLLERLAKEKNNKALVERVDKTIPAYVRSYIKNQVKPTLSPEQISSLVISTIEKNQPKPIEKIIERRIEIIKPVKETVKEDKKYDEQINELRAEIERLKKREPSPSIQVVGDSLPNHNGIVGSLYSDGSSLRWETVSGSSGPSNANPLNIGDPDTEGSWRLYDDGTDLLVQVLTSGEWLNAGSFTRPQ